MKKILTLFVIVFFTFTVQAQTNRATVSGTVTDGSQKTIESATIALLKASDSSTIKFSVADRSGKYTFNDIADGSYLVSISAVGHQKGFSKIFIVTPANHDIRLDEIELAPVSKSMSSVTVTAKKPLIEQKIDRTIVNVDASVTNVGSTAMEVLEKSPGVTVDKDGNISLKGKEGVLVMIDGRPTQLSGTDLANVLRSMHANQLDQIEIMTNPPAKYDAAGNAGIINIKTKKNKQAGYNGSASVGYGQGRYPKFNESVNMNYKEGKVNLFTNLNHNYRKNYNTLTIQRNLRNKNTKILENYFDQEANMINEGNSYNAKLGLDYFATKNTTIGFVLNGFTNPSTFANRNLTLISDPNHTLESRTKATADYDQSWKNFSTNLNFRTVLDTTGKELTSDLDFIQYKSKNDQTLINSYFDAAGNATIKADTLLGSLPQNISIYSGRIDYLQPMKKGARFEAGIKSSIVKTDNNAVYDSIQNGEIVHDLNRTNHFIYEENINAAYVNMSGQLSKKISAQLGLRVENTNAKGNQVTTGATFDRHYTQLFPTAYFQYKANEKNNFGLNYGRRIRRPNYESLNPFIRFLDRYTYMQGNPNLKPQFSHNIEASHTYKNFLTTTLNYSVTNDIIQGVIEQKGQEAYAKQANIARLRQYGIAVSANNPVTKWWTNSIYVNVYNNRFSGVVDSTPIIFSATSLALNGSQQFKLSKTLTAEISGFYRTSGIEGVIMIRSMGMLSAGFSKQVMKNKGTLRLNVRDILLSQKTNAKSKYGNVDASFQEARDSRVVNLGFTYRFSKGKVSNTKKRTNGSASDEQNRVGVGN
ncbi:MAG: TonB-dependent receptor domain-containing protein [Flavisolibacter sp.]